MSANFAIYLVGYSILTAGIAYGMHAVGLGQQWIITAVLIMIGVGVVAALSRSKSGNLADAKTQKTEQEAASA